MEVPYKNHNMNSAKKLHIKNKQKKGYDDDKIEIIKMKVKELAHLTEKHKMSEFSIFSLENWNRRDFAKTLLLF